MRFKSHSKQIMVALRKDEMHGILMQVYKKAAYLAFALIRHTRYESKFILAAHIQRVIAIENKYKDSIVA